MPLVSVIIPTYNRCRFLLEAIESVRQQDWSDLEIIVVDDGSTDETRFAIEALKEPRLRFRHQINQGRSIARNRGFELAQGELIAFLDDDDLFLPGKIPIQADGLLRRPEIDIIASGMRMIDGKGQVLWVIKPWKQIGEPTLLRLMQGCVLNPSSLMIRRSALLRTRVEFDPGLDYAEDTDYLLRLIAAGCRMGWAPKILTAYRKYEERPSWVDFAPMMNLPKILHRIFDRGGLAPEIEAQHTEILGQAQIALALRAFMMDMDQLGIKALIEAKRLTNLGAPRVADMVGRVSLFLPPDEQISFIEKIYSHMPFDWKEGRDQSIQRLRDLEQEKTDE